MFVDRVEVYVKGGDGGDGCLSFRREVELYSPVLGRKPEVVALADVLSESPS